MKVAHSVWSNNGFLSISNATPLLNIGSLDFAGSGVVHVTGESNNAVTIRFCFSIRRLTFTSFTGGATALLATLVLGPRRGRFYDPQGEPLEAPKPFPGHSVALQLLGTMVLWFGCKLNPKLL